MKRVGNRSYLHRSALSDAPSWVKKRVRSLEGDLNVRADVIRFGPHRALMLGRAPLMGVKPVVPLEESWTQKAGGQPVIHRRYRGESRPVYHRTELMLPSSHPGQKKLRAWSRENESFLGRRDIGTLRSWKRVRGKMR